jgi:hypothetical protein
MVLTRPKRRLIFLAVSAALIGLVAWAVLLPRSTTRYAPALSGWPVVSEGEKSFHYHGSTRWLIVERRDLRPVALGQPGRVERRYRINPPGLMEALVLIGLSVVACVWAHRRLVRRLTLDGYCDWCGYDLSGLDSGRCPECGRGEGGERPSDQATKRPRGRNGGLRPPDY